MRKISPIPLFALLCLLLFAFGCKREEAKSPPPAEDQASQTIPSKPSKLEEAIQLYENPSQPADAEEAVKVFYTHAYSNEPEAQYYLGLARMEGKGADQSKLEAYVWWTIAARQEHQKSMTQIKNAKEVFGKEDLAEINNRANDWAEKVRNTPEMNI